MRNWRPGKRTPERRGSEGKKNAKNIRGTIALNRSTDFNYSEGKIRGLPGLLILSGWKIERFEVGRNERNHAILWSIHERVARVVVQFFRGFWIEFCHGNEEMERGGISGEREKRESNVLAGLVLFSWSVRRDTIKLHGTMSSQCSRQPVDRKLNSLRDQVWMQHTLEKPE